MIISKYKNFLFFLAIISFLIPSFLFSKNKTLQNSNLDDTYQTSIIESDNLFTFDDLEEEFSVFHNSFPLKSIFIHIYFLPFQKNLTFLKLPNTLHNLPPPIS